MGQESALQSKIRKDLENEGWIVLKVSICNKPGWPDITIYKNQIVKFIEVKSEGKQPTKLQEYIHKIIRTQGFDVFVIDTWASYLAIKQTRLFL